MHITSKLWCVWNVNAVVCVSCQHRGVLPCCCARPFSHVEIAEALNIRSAAKVADLAQRLAPAFQHMQTVRETLAFPKMDVSRRSNSSRSATAAPSRTNSSNVARAASTLSRVDDDLDALTAGIDTNGGGGDWMGALCVPCRYCVLRCGLVLQRSGIAAQRLC